MGGGGTKRKNRGITEKHFGGRETHKGGRLNKKLRDILQEREVASLNYFKVFSNYIKQFSRTILLYLGLP